MNQNHIADALQGLQRRIDTRKPVKRVTGPKECQINGNNITGHISKRLKQHLDTKNDLVKSQIQRIKDHRGTTIFYGPNRTGKSCLAASIAWGFMESAKFAYSFNFLNEIKRTFDSKSENWAIPKHKLLVLDEFEKFNPGEWALTTLDQTLCQRHDDMLANIIITNLELPEIKNLLSGSLISRCSETGKFIRIDKPWFR